MWSKLVDILNSMQKGTLKNVLSGAGLMLGTNAIFLTTFSVAVNTLKNSTGSISSDVLGLAHLSGFDIAMSLILGAIVTRLTLNSQNLALKKASR
ncbi:DUF2523 family protein [Acinetobacter guillouiae]|uniref:DUF2523 family protein n=1 Tax=Acinetobacter guillouiae TaxID=106649 RepID=UPI0026E31C6B|nr:DUF2523 family protein [Acinetobacter guillouiae]MDO6642362.1 DUF2523 family protein [Acinetobacter guillouiae]MDO6642374.1 DUF2523 family protein [Acinetobacter guillouiae]